MVKLSIIVWCFHSILIVVFLRPFSTCGLSHLNSDERLTVPILRPLIRSFLWVTLRILCENSKWNVDNFNRGPIWNSPDERQCLKDCRMTVKLVLVVLQISPVFHRSRCGSAALTEPKSKMMIKMDAFYPKGPTGAEVSFEELRAQSYRSVVGARTCFVLKLQYVTFFILLVFKLSLIYSHHIFCVL